MNATSMKLGRKGKMLFRTLRHSSHSGSANRARVGAPGQLEMDGVNGPCCPAWWIGARCWRCTTLVNLGPESCCGAIELRDEPAPQHTAMMPFSSSALSLSFSCLRGFVLLYNNDFRRGPCFGPKPLAPSWLSFEKYHKVIRSPECWTACSTLFVPARFSSSI